VISFGGRTLWVSPFTEYREAKLFVPNSTELIGDEDRLNKYYKNIVNFDYLVDTHIDKLIVAFRCQFSTENYRRTSNAGIVVKEDFIALARVARVNSSSEYEVIEVSLGLMYAIEDMWQCVISDNNTDLHAYCGVPYKAPNNVIRDINHFHDLDQQRFYDYSMVESFYESKRSMLSDTDGITDPNHIRHFIGLHNLLVSKMVSGDTRRVNFGCLLSDLSFTWILAHEDAHIYSAHSDYFKSELGISADELEQEDELFMAAHKALLERNDSDKLSELRVLSELHADELACIRMVDYLFDDEIFDLYPDLRGGVSYVMNTFQGSTTKATEREARFIVVMRLIISSAISSVFLFYRNIEKKNIVAVNYPQINIRLSNIIINTLFRAFIRLDIQHANKWQSFDFPKESVLFFLGAGISQDIHILKWNLLSHPMLIKDPDLPSNKELKFSEFEEAIQEGSTTLRFVFDSLLYVKELTGGVNIKRLSYLAATSRTIFDLLSYQSNYYDRFSEVYKSRQIRNNPKIIEKYKETYTDLKNQSRDLSAVVKIAEKVRPIIRSRGVPKG